MHRKLVWNNLHTLLFFCLFVSTYKCLLNDCSVRGFLWGKVHASHPFIQDLSFSEISLSLLFPISSTHTHTVCAKINRFLKFNFLIYYIYNKLPSLPPPFLSFLPFLCTVLSSFANIQNLVAPTTIKMQKLHHHKISLPGAASL